MDVNRLAVSLFSTSVLFQELLDSTDGVTQFKNKTRFHINGLQDCLDKLNSVKIDKEDVSLKVHEAVKKLEEVFDIGSEADNQALSED
jgi:hypothetical protein